MMDPTTISTPRSRADVVSEIITYLEEREFDLEDFETVDGAMHTVWPELYNHDKLASLIVTINVYLEICRQKGFEVQPAWLINAKMEGLI